MISSSPNSRNTAVPSTVSAAQMSSLKRKACCTPSRLPEPKNCAPKMPAPDTAPKTARLKTNIKVLATLTPRRCASSMRPTMMLSKRLTNCVMPFWIMIGTASESTMA